MASTVQDTPLKLLRSPGPNVDCHPEQAQRGIWASRAMRRVLCDAIIARLARFPIAGCPILNFALFAKFRVGTLTRPHRPSRHNSVIPTGAKRSGGTLCFRTRAKTNVPFKQTQGGILHQPLGIRTGMTGDLG